MRNQDPIANLNNELKSMTEIMLKNTDLSTEAMAKKVDSFVILKIRSYPAYKDRIVEAAKAFRMEFCTMAYEKQFRIDLRKSLPENPDKSVLDTFELLVKKATKEFVEERLPSIMKVYEEVPAA